jgi:uncharacterized protein YjeT (DUF2065 family)
VIGEAIRVSMPLAELVTIAGVAFGVGFIVGWWVRR